MRRRALLICLLLSGSAGLAYELLWTRLLALSFGSTTLSLSTVLAVFFGGLGVGSWLAGRRASALASPTRTYMRLELGIAFFGLALYPVLKHLGSVFALVGVKPLFDPLVLSMLQHPSLEKPDRPNDRRIQPKLEKRGFPPHFRA